MVHINFIIRNQIIDKNKNSDQHFEPPLQFDLNQSTSYQYVIFFYKQSRQRQNMLFSHLRILRRSRKTHKHSGSRKMIQFIFILQDFFKTVFFKYLFCFLDFKVKNNLKSNTSIIITIIYFLNFRTYNIQLVLLLGSFKTSLHIKVPFVSEINSITFILPS